MDIPNISNLDESQIKMILREGQVQLYYGKNKLYVKTGCWTCPYGINDGNALVCVVPDQYCEKLNSLDDLARSILMDHHEQIYGTPAPEDVESLQYIPLMKTLENGLETIRMPIADHVRIFDSNGERVTDRQYMSSQFSAYFLLDMSTLTCNKGYVSWSLWPVQIKIKRYCVLPEGCLIYDTVEDVNKAVKQRVQIKPKPKHTDALDAVVEFTPDVNELLD